MKFPAIPWQRVSGGVSLPTPAAPLLPLAGLKTKHIHVHCAAHCAFSRPWLVIKATDRMPWGSSSTGKSVCSTLLAAV